MILRHEHLMKVTHVDATRVTETCIADHDCEWTEVRALRVYISGPMTGYEDHNFPAFNAAAAELRALGYEVINPAETGHVEGYEWSDYLRLDMRYVSEVDAIYTLPGWHESRGARLEMHVALTLGLLWLNPEDEPLESVLAAFEAGEKGVTADPYAGLGCDITVTTQPSMSGEVRTVSATGGEKGSKLARFGLIPMAALRKVAEHYGIGAKKYEDHNWRRGYPWSLSFDAMMRHAQQFWDGEDNDEETGSPHPAAIAFHALTLLTFMEEQRDYDDRFRPASK